MPSSYKREEACFRSRAARHPRSNKKPAGRTNEILAFKSSRSPPESAKGDNLLFAENHLARRAENPMRPPRGVRAERSRALRHRGNRPYPAYATQRRCGSSSLIFDAVGGREGAPEPSPQRDSLCEELGLALSNAKPRVKAPTPRFLFASPTYRAQRNALLQSISKICRLCLQI